jgi:hypothetical protein
VLLAEAAPKASHSGPEPVRVTGAAVTFGPYRSLSPEVTLAKDAPRLSVHSVNHAGEWAVLACVW